MGVESFGHAAAKNIFAGWLRDIAAPAGNEWVNFGGLSWRVNRGAPHYGVWIEYPVLANGFGICPVWDEEDDRWKDRPPSYDELVAEGNAPAVIFDIAVQHKGSIIAAVEIVHKHKISEKKLTAILAMEDRPNEVWQIPAHWILGQIRIPTKVPSEFLVINGNDISL